MRYFKFTIIILTALFLFYVYYNKKNEVNIPVLFITEEEVSLEIPRRYTHPVYFIDQNGYYIKLLVPITNNIKNDVEIIFNYYTKYANQLPMGIKSPLHLSSELLSVIIKDDEIVLTTNKKIAINDVDYYPLINSLLELEGIKKVKIIEDKDVNIFKNKYIFNLFFDEPFIEQEIIKLLFYSTSNKDLEVEVNYLINKNDNKYEKILEFLLNPPKGLKTYIKNDPIIIYTKDEFKAKILDNEILKNEKALAQIKYILEKNYQITLNT